MIELNNIHKSFGSHEVLRDVTFNLHRGDFLTLTGHSGIGKTTLINIVSGILAPDSGTVKCSSRRIGYAFQKDILIPWMSAAENIAYVLERDMPGNKAYDVAAHWLDRVGLGDSINKKPASMSGGMKKRVNIARALSIKPDIILLDEPFAFLDESAIASVEKLLGEIMSEGDSAVILAAHDIRNSSYPGGKVFELTGAPVVIRD